MSTLPAVLRPRLGSRNVSHFSPSSISGLRFFVTQRWCIECSLCVREIPRRWISENGKEEGGREEGRGKSGSNVEGSGQKDFSKRGNR